jgi:hypothetical protein
MPKGAFVLSTAPASLYRAKKAERQNNLARQIQ